MNEIKRLASEIQATLPRANVRPDCPTDDRSQTCWLNVEFAGHSVAVEWRPGKGFGVSKVEASEGEPLAGLFSRPSRVVSTCGEAYEAVLGLLGVGQRDSVHGGSRQRLIRRTASGL
jgi:hypothetical protein